MIDFTLFYITSYYHKDDDDEYLLDDCCLHVVKIANDKNEISSKGAMITFPLFPVMALVVY